LAGWNYVIEPLRWRFMTLMVSKIRVFSPSWQRNTTAAPYGEGETMISIVLSMTSLN